MVKFVCWTFFKFTRFFWIFSLNWELGSSFCACAKLIRFGTSGCSRSDSSTVVPVFICNCNGIVAAYWCFVASVMVPSRIVTTCSFQYCIQHLIISDIRYSFEVSPVLIWVDWSGAYFCRMLLRSLSLLNRRTWYVLVYFCCPFWICFLSGVVQGALWWLEGTFKLSVLLMFLRTSSDWPYL